MTNGGGGPDPGHFGVVAAPGTVVSVPVAVVPPAQRSSSAELAAIIPGATVVSALQVDKVQSIPDTPSSPRVGTVVAAAVAPATGKIDAPPESLVALTVKHFWDSPTIIKARRILIGALVTGVLASVVILKTALDAGKSIFELPWGQAGTVLLTVAFGALIAAGTTAITTGYFVRQKVSDNNPTDAGAVNGTKGP